MQFTKMEGLGNDFVVVDGSVEVTPDLVRRLRDRHSRRGSRRRAPGHASKTAAFAWDIGTPMAASPKCAATGCDAWLALPYDRGLAAGHVLHDRDTGRREAGDRCPTIPGLSSDRSSVRGSFEFEGWVFHRVEVGNPHAVAFVADLSVAPVAELGSELARLTPGGVNVEFVRVVDRQKIEMRVWERGVGETMACGSGMVAAAAAAQHLGFHRLRSDRQGSRRRRHGRTGRHHLMAGRSGQLCLQRRDS